MPKPIVRWTFYKNSAREGHDCLRKSIKCWRKVYQDEFDCYVCANEYFEGLKSYENEGVKIINQSDFVDSLSIKPFKTCWKFYPPRININTHEIFLDNDVIIYKRSPTFDLFLKSDMMITSEGHTRHLGQFDKLVKGPGKINTGIMGVPPGYDFQKKILDFLKLYCKPEGWVTHIDDQGCFAYLMLDYYSWKLVPFDEVAIVNPCVPYAPYMVGTSGIHFIGINNGQYSYYKHFLKNDAHLMPMKIIKI